MVVCGAVASAEPPLRQRHQLIMHSSFRTTLCSLGFLPLAFSVLQGQQTAILNDQAYINHGLVGVGRVPASTLDMFGETFGSYSGFSFDKTTWSRDSSGTYSGVLYTQPDRGYSTSGTTTNYVPRFHKLSVSFTPAQSGSVSQNQAVLSIAETVKYSETNGTPMTGADPRATGSGVRAGFPALPEAFNGRLSLDPEGIVVNRDGSVWVSDEYGPYVYRFSADGVLLQALRPPEAFIPKRGGLDSFSSSSPYPGQPSVVPSNPTTGRQNSQGLEGLSVSPDGSTLFTLLQSATRQDGGSGGSSMRQNTRLLAYDLTTATPTLKGEYVIVLPSYLDGANTRIAACSEILAINNQQILVLARDSNGRGTSNPTSLYRKVVLYDISGATNILSTAYDSSATPISPGSILNAGIVPAVSAALVDINDANQLAKFGLANGPIDNANTLSDKWEALALVPALDPAAPHDWFLFVGNDNDFLTPTGFQDGTTYNAGIETDSMVLVYRLTIPTSLPYISVLARTGNGSNSVGNAAQTGSFVVSGARPKTMLIRGVGPTLANLGIANGVANPILTLIDSTGTTLKTNSNWGADPVIKADLVAAAAASGAFPLLDGSLDAALLVTLDPGTYSINLKSSGGPGLALLEIIQVP
jgi:hypothetical protein